MSLCHVLLPTEEVIIAHEDTYCRLGEAGVHPFAVTEYVLQQIVGPDEMSAREMLQTDTHELGQGLLEFLCEDLHCDIAKIDYALYEALCRAVNDLYACLMRVRNIIFGVAGPHQFVSGISQGIFKGADMMVTVELTDMRPSSHV